MNKNNYKVIDMHVLTTTVGPADGDPFVATPTFAGMVVASHSDSNDHAATRCFSDDKVTAPRHPDCSSRPAWRQGRSHGNSRRKGWLRPGRPGRRGRRASATGHRNGSKFAGRGHPPTLVLLSVVRLAVPHLEHTICKLIVVV